MLMKLEWVPQKNVTPDVIVATGTKPGSVTIPEIRDDAELTLLTALSAFGDSTYPYFISKNKTFEKTALEGQQLSESHDYTIRTSPKTFITETLLINWIEIVFLVRINGLRQKFAYEGPVILRVDGHSTHVTPRGIAFCGANRIILVRLVPHSSHISQPLDLCVLGIVKILYKRGNQTKGMKGETRKIYRVLLSFYKSTNIPMIRSNFVRAGFLPKPDNLLAPSESMGRGFLEELRFLNFPSTKLSCTRKQSISQVGQEYPTSTGSSFRSEFIRGQSCCIHRESYRNLPPLWS
jgi:hypothetical protein